MLEEMTKAVVNKVIAEDYPHLKLPAVVYATVTRAQKLAETFEVNELTIYNDEGGGSYKGHIVVHWYEYTLTIIDRFGNVDEEFPVVPGVRSKKQFEAGAVVALALAYGDIAPAIIGEVVL